MREHTYAGSCEIEPPAGFCCTKVFRHTSACNLVPVDAPASAQVKPVPAPQTEIKIGQVWTTHGGAEVTVIGYTPDEVLCWTVQTRNGAKFDLDADGRRRYETRSGWDLKLFLRLVKEGDAWPPGAPAPLPANPQPIQQIEMYESKASNPKEAVGDTKVPLALLSPIAKLYWAGAQALGMFKYGGWNWRAAGVRTSTYLSAMERHMDGYKSGERLDPADGTHHLGNIMACCSIILDAEAAGKLTDDRPPIVGHRKALEEVEANIAALRVKYAEKRPRHWTIADTDEIAGSGAPVAEPYTQQRMMDVATKFRNSYRHADGLPEDQVKLVLKLVLNRYGYEKFPMVEEEHFEVITRVLEGLA